MHVLAVSVRYPTVFQTWFINYLASLEQQDVDCSVLSLFEGYSQYPERINHLKTKLIWTARTEPKRDLIHAVWYGLRNALRSQTYRHIYSAFADTNRIKEAVMALSLLPGLEHRADLIHCHSEKAAFQLLPLLKQFNVPIALTFHGLAPEGLPELSEAQRGTLYRSVARVFVNTSFAARQHRTLSNQAVPIRIVPQGIDVASFPYCPRRHSGNGPLILLTVGRFDRLKGHRYAMEAVARLKRQGLKLEYWLVGAGLYEQDLRKIAEDLELRDQVKILGSKSGEDLVAVYHQAHIFLLPSTDEPGSWAETQGIVVQEAQACGVVTVATRSGGIPECVIDGATGLLVEQKSSEAIAQAVQSLASAPESWRSYQDAARAHVVEHFDYRLMGKRLLDCYHEILAEDDCSSD